jgi:hypothetical protein
MKVKEFYIKCNYQLLAHQDLQNRGAQVSKAFSQVRPDIDPGVSYRTTQHEQIYYIKSSGISASTTGGARRHAPIISGRRRDLWSQRAEREANKKTGVEGKTKQPKNARSSVA